ncbi:MAG: MerR family transcriptional regulator [Solobacterium sp.]|nr:MerR family transcriptional regulator [Solobacterium sp.]
MKYTQKDICRLLNIKRETLRHYEKEGIIRPEVNADNQYRFYDDYQFYLISECKRYQTNGFSIPEIRQMLQKDSLSEYTARMALKQKEIEKEAEQLLRMNELTKDYLMKLKSIPVNLNRIAESRMEDILFIPQRQGRLLKLDEDSVNASRMIMSSLHLTFMMAYCPDIRTNAFEWGFGTRFGMSEKETEYIPGSRMIRSEKALTCVIDTGSAWEFDAAILQPLLDEAEKRHFKPLGSCVMLQLLRSHEDDGIHRYFETYLPVG